MSGPHPRSATLDFHRKALPPQGVRFLPGADTIAVLSIRAIEIWSTSGVLKERVSLADPLSGTCVWAIPEGGEWFALCGPGADIRLVDRHSGAEFAQLALPARAEAYLSAESPGLASFVALLHSDGSYEDLGRRFSPYHTCCSLAIAPDASATVAAYGQAYALAWDLRAGTLRTCLGDDSPSRVPPRIYRVAWSPDGRLIATRDNLGRLRIWDVESRKERLCIAVSDAERPAALDRPLDMPGELGLVGGIEPLAFSPDSDVVATGDAVAVNLWSTATGRLKASWHGHEPLHPIMSEYPEAPRLLDIRSSRSGRRALTVGVDTTLRVWDAASGAEIWHVRPAPCCVDWADMILMGSASCGRDVQDCTSTRFRDSNVMSGAGGTGERHNDACGCGARRGCLGEYGMRRDRYLEPSRDGT